MLKIKMAILLILVFILTSCTQNKTSNENNPNNLQNEQIDEIEALEKFYTIQNQAANNENSYYNSDTLKEIRSVIGDLDGDTIPEKVVAFETQRTIKDKLGKIRELHIYKKKNNNWELSHKSIGAILPSNYKDALISPFGGLSIQQGVITIEQSYEDGNIWNYIHRFKCQNNIWELISVNVWFRKSCETQTFYYNLLSGEYLFAKELCVYKI